RLADLDPLGPVAASLMLSTIALLPAALARPLHGIPGSAALLALVVLGVVCTALGLVVFFQLIAEAGPNRASLITYVNPLVAVAVGVGALHEHVGAATLTRLLLILVGSWLAAGRRVEQPAGRGARGARGAPSISAVGCLSSRRR